MAEKPQELDETAAGEEVKLDANLEFGIPGLEFTEAEWTRIARWLMGTFGGADLNEWLGRKWAQFDEAAGADVDDGAWVLFIYRELLADPPRGMSS